MGRLPIIYRVVHHKEKGEEFPVISAYTETYDTVNDPKAAKNLKEASQLKNAQKNANPDIPEAKLPPLEWSMNIKNEASQLKNAQKNANPNIPEAKLPPLEWSMNIKVLEAGVGRRAGKEIRGLGRAGVRQSSSSTPRSRVHKVEERLHIAEERAEKAEAVT